MIITAGFDHIEAFLNLSRIEQMDVTVADRSSKLQHG